MNYQWNPLDKDRKEIRVLDLEPGNESAPIVGSIRHVFLDEPEKHKYETISYTWGEYTLTASVSVEGRLVAIPESAASALRCMRLLDKRRTLWIDAICIDQNDPAEKGHQVGMMADIFTKCSGNLSHLGADDGTVEAAFDGFTAVYQQCSQQVALYNDGRFDHRDIGTIERVAHWMGSARKANDILPCAFEIDAVESLLRRAYFSRLWIVQEIVLPTTTSLYAGAFRLDFHVFYSAYFWLLFLESENSQERLFNPWEMQLHELVTHAAPAMSWVLHLLKDVAHMNASKSLEKLMSTSRGLQVTDPRDRIYGLMGLMERIYPARVHNRILRCDYTKSVIELYCDATRAAVADCRSLSIFDCGFDESHEKMDGLPTWVPNWYHNNENHALVLNLITRPNCSAWPSRRWNPVDIQESFLEGTCDHMILSLVGIRIDLIRVHTETFTPGESTFNCGLQLMSRVLPMAATWSRYMTELDTHLSTTLIADSRFSEDSETFSRSQGYHSLKVCMEKSTPQNPATMGGLWSDAHGYYAFGYLSEMAQICRQRRFFVTESDSIGIGPRALEEGDIVAVVARGRYPFILRRADDRGSDFYTMIGPAYVHEIMNGEVFKIHPGRSEALETFHLV